MRTFLIYAVVEMAVIIALTATIGFGWTVIALLGAFVLGIALAGSQLRRQLEQLQRGMRDPRAQVTDSALVALGSVLVFVPGLVTTLIGLLMLAPPTRSVVRPLATALAARGLSRRVAFVGRPDYIDGEVIQTNRTATEDAHPGDPDGPDGPDVYEARDEWPPMLPAVLPKPE